MSTTARTSAPAESANLAATSPVWHARAEARHRRRLYAAFEHRWAIALGATAVLAGRSVLPLAQDTDVSLAGLGILLTAVYMTGLIFRPRRQILGMGVDSLAVLALYGIGTVGLVLIAGGT